MRPLKQDKAATIIKELIVALGVSRFLLISLGIWPLTKNAPMLLKCRNYLAILLSYAFLLYLVTSFVLYLFLEDLDIQTRIENVAPLIFGVVSISKYIVLTVKGRSIGSCYEYIEVDWRRSRSSHNVKLYIT